MNKPPRYKIQCRIRPVNGQQSNWQDGETWYTIDMNEETARRRLRLMREAAAETKSRMEYRVVREH